MRSVFIARIAPLLAAALAVAFLPSAGSAAVAGSAPAGGTPLRARVTGEPIRGTQAGLAAGHPPAATGLPTKKNQIKVLTAVLNKMRKHYAQYQVFTPGPEDVFGYGVGSLWRKGIDGAGTTIAVIEGWNYPAIQAQVKGFDKIFGLPNPQITTIYPAGKLPKKCPPGMVKLGSYGSCSAWAGELTLDVLSAHLMAPYAKIVISATPADTQETDDAASQVAPPEMMEALEYIARHHSANVISISDGTGESSYSRGQAEILAQNPGELAAAAAGIPVLVATGDCGVVQNLPAANSQCENTSGEPDTAAWDDSPWVTAVGGSLPNLNSKGNRAGSDPLWSGSGAGYSSVFARPSYQDGVARITGSAMRSVPDITLDSSDGTSEAAPMLNGILALATQVNHGNVGPINPALYQVLGPRGLRDGIADVVHGSDPGFGKGGQTIAGFSAAKGFDVASGWGTIRAGAFVPALAAATRAAHQDAAVRRQAQAGLTAAEHRLRLSATRIAKGGSSYLLASGFLPGHPVELSIDGHAVARLAAGILGTVTYMIDPGQLKLAAGRHVVRLASMLVTMTRSFRSR
jgi:subtilase family serine protease